MLNDQQFFSLFQRVGSKSLMVSIFRDLTLSYHVEFEAVATALLSKKTLGNEVGKKAVRHIAKSAVLTVGYNMRQRRSFALLELIKIRATLQLEPGLVAPKLPQIIAAMSIAKTELLAYVRHYDQAESVRGDTRKRYHIDRYIGTDVIPLLSNLCGLVEFVSDHEWIIRRYYSEYLINDYKAVETIFKRCSEQLPSMIPLLTAMIDDLKSFRGSLNSDFDCISVDDTSAKAGSNANRVSPIGTCTVKRSFEALGLHGSI